jgi:class 3 adenylate cyclase
MAATSFTDIAGFTPLVETLEPDVIGPLLNDYLGGMPDVVFAHDGTVGKIVGDAIHMLLARPRSSPTMRCLRWRVDWCHSACNFGSDSHSMNFVGDLRFSIGGISPCGTVYEFRPLCRVGWWSRA